MKNTILLYIVIRNTSFLFQFQTLIIKMIDRKSPHTVIIFLHLLKTQLHLNSSITQISRQKFLANKIRLSCFSHHEEIDTKCDFLSRDRFYFSYHTHISHISNL